MITIQIGWIDSLPFPAVVSDEEGVVLTANYSFSRLIEPGSSAPDAALRSLFKDWRSMTANLTLGVYKERHFLLLNQPFTWDSQALFLYLLADDSHIFQLNKQISAFHQTNKELDAIIESS